MQLELLSADSKAEMYFRLFVPGGVVVLKVAAVSEFCLCELMFVKINL